MRAVQLFPLTVIAMIAFAANSVLNRLAVGQSDIDPIIFAVIRLAGGAAMLGLLLALRGLRGGSVWAGGRGRVTGVFGLLVYLFGFSLAYLSLDAGGGALILFGSVQVTMFVGAVVSREAVPLRRWLGAILAFAGLGVLMAPGGSQSPDLVAGGAMTMAGIGWGVYSLAGRGVRDALGATAWNFILALPVGLLVLQLIPVGPDSVPTTTRGLSLAVLSGAVTSGLGYALWYRIVPTLGAARAAVAQLTVPLIAAAGGAVLIGEGVGLRFAVASGLVLGGVALASLQTRKVRPVP